MQLSLSEFRSKYPGLYDQAFSAGVEQERDRQHQIRKIKPAGASADRALDNGWTVADTIPRFREFAARSDVSAAAFESALAELGLTASGQATSEEQAAERLARRLEASRQAPGASQQPADLGDLFAEALPPRDADATQPAPEPTRESAPALSTPRTEPASADIGDLFAQDLKPRKGSK